jgi:uncharacterized phiE125 gp8 family phage protein
MSYKVTTVDRNTLAAELLPLVKKQLRVLSTTDDEFITGLIVRTIDVFERQSGLTIFRTSADWKPDEFDPVSSSGVMLPLQPIANGWVARDSSGVDVTADYEIVGAMNGRAAGLYFRALESGKSTKGITVALVAGSASVEEIPPGALQAILSRVASLYAWREDLSETAVNELALTDNVWMTGNWVPRA